MTGIVLRLRGLTLASPQVLGEAAPVIAIPEMVPRNCQLGPYKKQKVRKVALPAGTQIVAYASPDSTFAVTKRLMDSAKKSILIGIYDFSAGHMRDLLLDALARGVKVSLMLDIDSKTEREFFDHLVEMGVRGVSAPSCANSAVRLFSSSHEKVIVIDGKWCLVQSGNYSSNSIPLNTTDGGGQIFRTGNRDMGLAIQSTKLARFFTTILEKDMAVVEAVPEALQRPPDDEFFVVEAAPKGPTKKFKSQEFTLDSGLDLTPILSPDNYMDVVPGLLAKARKSILIEQQYIRSSQPLVRKLLQAIRTAKTHAPQLDVRIVLGKVFEDSKLTAEKKMLKDLADNFGLKLARNVRYINTDQFVHCHNKMIIIDGEGVLVSSQNWSDSAVSKNREAGVFLSSTVIASYFTRIFDYDWESAFQKLPDGGVPEMLAPADLQGGGYVRVEKADFEEI